MRSTVVSRLTVTGGLLLLATAAVLALVPMRGNGLAGNAVRPHYSAFGWVAYQPLPTHPTVGDLRRAGVPVPQDLVTSRRHLVVAIGATGLATTALGLLARQRPDGTGVEEGRPWAS